MRMIAILVVCFATVAGQQPADQTVVPAAAIDAAVESVAQAAGSESGAKTTDPVSNFPLDNLFIPGGHGGPGGPGDGFGPIDPFPGTGGQAHGDDGFYAHRCRECPRGFRCRRGFPNRVYCFARRGCDLPVNRGYCNKHLQHFYYDRYSRRCRSFIYGGCGGNLNNFVSYDRCVGTCEARPKCKSNRRGFRGGPGPGRIGPGY